MEFSTLFKLHSNQLTTEAEVETRFLAKLFNDLGYSDDFVIPKKRLKPLITFEGSKRTSMEVDFLLLDSNRNPKIIVEAKDPKKNVIAAWGQAASYALSYNRDKTDSDKIKWIIISNGHITSLFTNESDTPFLTLRLSDFASGSPPYVNLRTFLKFKDAFEVSTVHTLPFESITPDKLNQLFFKCHDLVWKKEKMNPTDAFFEFCKFIFIKIREDKKRESMDPSTEPHLIPLTSDWLAVQEKTSSHPVRDILFKNLHTELENAIITENKKRIFEPNETLKLSASTCKELIKEFQSINLSSIDEDLNGRMFEVFLNAAVRGRALGQYFTPRPVVDFMTRIALRNARSDQPPKIIDACCGTAGFLIEAMAYLISGLREDTRYNNKQKEEFRRVICNESLYGVEANERVARIARINMYLHGDGGSNIFHGDGLDLDPLTSEDMNREKIAEVNDHRNLIKNESFDIILTNPPFSMVYKSSNEDENRILKQYPLTTNSSSAKSNLIFLNRYYKLLKPGGELLIVIDDTILNGKSMEAIRKWMLEKFVLLAVHSLPFNAFFKANANIKTSILHLRKKSSSSEAQGHVFMSVNNNIGHDNALKDTPHRNNLIETLIAYLEWQRTGELEPVIKHNVGTDENLECPQQYFLVSPESLTIERFDSFFYSLHLKYIYQQLSEKEMKNEIEIIYGRKINLRSKLSRAERNKLIEEECILKYIEISDVTKYGLITNYTTGTLNQLPSRGEYMIRKGDVLLALNNSSRGTVVLVPEEFDGAICTSGFLVIKTDSIEDSYLLWYALRSEYCREQIYYLAQTASQPELKIESWNRYFQIPMPKGHVREEAITKTKNFFSHMDALLYADKVKLE